MNRQIVSLRSCFLVATVLAVISSAAEAASYDVYILTGQSNSLGVTYLQSDWGAGTHAADAETAFFWSNVNASESSDPYNIVLYGDSADEISTLQMQQGIPGTGNVAFWGPEMGFARTLYDAGERDVMIIKLSRGGGGNNYWLPNTGHMYNHIMDQLDVALGAAQAAGDTFDVKGLLYLQGESNDSTGAAQADTRLRTLIDDVRSHVNTNFNDAAENMRTIIGEIAASQSNANRQQTTMLQKSLAENYADVSFVPTSDLPLLNDFLHFGRDSKLEVGARFGRSLLGLPIKPDEPAIASYSADASSVETIPHPSSQGWTEIKASSGVTTEGVVVDGTYAWRVVDDSSASNPGYRHVLIPEDFREMYEKGWEMTLEMQVPRGGGLAFWSLDAANDPGWNIGSGSMNGFVFDRLTDDSLDVTLYHTDWKTNLGPGSADLFHAVKVLGVPFSTAYSVYIDGEYATSGNLQKNFLVSGYNNMASFLSGSTGGTGREILWNNFDLRAVPEPSGILMLIVLSFFCMWRRERKKR